MGIIGWTNDESTVIGSRKSLSVWKLPCWPQMESNATNHWATHDHSPRERKPRAWIAHGWPAFVVFVWKQEPLRAVMHHDMECKWIRCPSAKRSPAQSRHKKPPRMTCSCSVHSFIRMRRSHWVMMYRLKGIASLRSCIWGDKKVHNWSKQNVPSCDLQNLLCPTKGFDCWGRAKAPICLTSLMSNLKKVRNSMCAHILPGQGKFTENNKNALQSSDVLEYCGLRELVQ